MEPLGLRSLPHAARSWASPARNLSAKESWSESDSRKQPVRSSPSSVGSVGEEALLNQDNPLARAGRTPGSLHWLPGVSVDGRLMYSRNERNIVKQLFSN